MPVLYFDMDDTIYERRVPFMEAYERFFGRRDEELSSRAYHTCAFRSNEVFEDSQTGRISMEEMYIYRYQKGLQDVGITISDEDALTFQKLYTEQQKAIHPSPCMKELLAYCKESFDRLGMITNGPGPHQRNKMHALGLDDIIEPELIFISGEQKIVKPYPEIFERAQAASGVEASELVMIGDNYPVDLKVPAGMGWQTIWLNREHKTMEPGDPKVTFTVDTEEALFLVLKSLAMA